MADHQILIVGSGMHLIAKCPVCGDLGASMVRSEHGTPAERFLTMLNEAIRMHERVQALAESIRRQRG